METIIEQIRTKDDNIRPQISTCHFTPPSIAESDEDANEIDQPNIDEQDILLATTPTQPITAPHTNAIQHPLCDPSASEYKTKSTIRIMRKALLCNRPAVTEYRIHLDGGANMSVTPDQSLLINYRNIKKHAIAGVAEGQPAIFATGVGYLPWQATTGETILVKCHYSEQAADTIISPTDVVVNRITDYHAWSQYADVDTGTGYIAFHHRHTDHITRYDLVSINKLWYFRSTTLYDYHSIRALNDAPFTPTIHRLTSEAAAELRHQRFGHPGETTEKSLPKHLKGCPVIKTNQFRRCKCCMDFKATDKLPRTAPPGPKPNSTLTPGTPASDDDNELRALQEEVKALSPGQMFQMDMGFVRGSGYSKEDQDGRRITSLDGYNSYLSIIDRKTRRQWVFLTKTKFPQIDVIRKFLQAHGCKTSTRKIIRTDQGGELWGSQDFQRMAKEENYLLESTGAGAPHQNGLVERPNRTLATIMGCLLYNAGLGPQYWSWALLHAVYIKNRLPHRATGTTPYFAWTGTQPDATHMLVFGCPVIVKLRGQKRAKLDKHTSHGIFLGFTATDHNVYYQDYATGRIKIATHVTFDEAGFTLPTSELSPGMKILQQVGLPKDLSAETPAQHTLPEQPPEPDTHLQIKLLTEFAQPPRRATPEAAGYDLFSAVHLVIEPHQRALVATNISIKPPAGTYGQIVSRSGLAIK